MNATIARFENVFVLGTGRCGTLSFIHACQHINNYTAGHETRSGVVGQQRMAYPRNHIEADNRLTWFLGRLDQQHGDSAYYVHLRRDPQKTANSFANRYSRGIIRAYRSSILLNASSDSDRLHVCRDYVETVTSNIQHFLRGRPHQIEIDIEHAESAFERFWCEIGATGDLNAARRELIVRHNATAKGYSIQHLVDLAARVRHRFAR